jgi:hypothetical protein
LSFANLLLEMSEKKLQFAILEYVQSQVNSATPDQREGLEVAFDCLSTFFGLNLADDAQRAELSVAPTTLLSAFQSGVALVQLKLMSSLRHLIAFSPGYRCFEDATAEATASNLGGGRCVFW